MNLVDSCGWLEYFADGPNAGFFAPPLEDADKLIVPTICVLEVFINVGGSGLSYCHLSSYFDEVLF